MQFYWNTTPFCSAGLFVPIKCSGPDTDPGTSDVQASNEQAEIWQNPQSESSELGIKSVIFHKRVSEGLMED